MASLGIEENRLYYISFDDFIKRHPELKNLYKDLQEKKYNHYEEKRKNLIQLSIKKRREIIEDNKKSKKIQKSSSAAYVLEQGSTMLREEKEKLKHLRNQQITELKNLIEYEFKLEEIRKRNEEKIKIQEQKEEEMRKKREREKKEKEEKQRK